MKLQETDLENLLNDESFICWLKEEADPKTKEKWERWLSKNPDHQRVVKKAKKILNMPFKSPRGNKNLSEELERLEKRIADSRKDHSA